MYLRLQLMNMEQIETFGFQNTLEMFGVLNRSIFLSMYLYSGQMRAMFWGVSLGCVDLFPEHLSLFFPTQPLFLVGAPAWPVDLCTWNETEGASNTSALNTLFCSKAPGLAVLSQLGNLHLFCVSQRFVVFLVWPRAASAAPSVLPFPFWGTTHCKKTQANLYCS